MRADSYFAVIALQRHPSLGSTGRHSRNGGFMAKRGIRCPCGHWMEAHDDATLFVVVRQHVDDRHSELHYSDQQIRDMIEADGVTTA